MSPDAATALSASFAGCHACGFLSRLPRIHGDAVRCPRCHVALWSNYAGAGDTIRFVRVGTLDDPDSLPPDIHIYTNSKQPWVLLPPNVPAVEEYYDRSRYWPDESLARRRAVVS